MIKEEFQFKKIMDTGPLGEAVWENAADAMALSDPEGYILAANPACYRLFGYSPEQALGKRISIFFPEDIQDEVLKKYKTLFRQSGEEFVVDQAIRSKDGKTLELELHITFIIDQGLKVAMLSMFRDMTLHKLTEQTLRRHALEIEELYRTSNEITAQLELPKLLKAILDRSARLLEIHSGGLLLVAPDGNALELAVHRNIPPNLTNLKFQLGEGVAGRVAQNGEPLVVYDYQNWPGRTARLEQLSIYRYLGVPLRVGKNVIGVIILFDDLEEHFSERQIRLACLFADQAAIALENARLYEHARAEIADRKRREEQTSRQNRELSLLYGVIAAATSFLEPEKVLETTVEQLAQGLNIPQAGAALLDESHSVLTLVAEYLQDRTHSALGAKIPVVGNPSTQYVLENKTPIAITDAQQDPRMAPIHDLMRQRGVTSILILPMIVRGQVIGTIGLDSFEHRVFTSEEIKLAFNAASAAAQAIENARLYSRMQKMAITDELTGLYNRRAFFDLGSREVSRSKRYNTNLSAILLDLDHFKKINDHHGHAIGDLVLKMVAELCRKTTRQIDIIGRYGGDEIAILLPVCSQQSAQSTANRLRSNIEKMEIKSCQTQVLVTASLGVSQLDENTNDIHALISAADVAMYTAKQSGRNQVMTFMLNGSMVDLDL